jgi:hypothetical protein
MFYDTGTKMFIDEPQIFLLTSLSLITTTTTSTPALTTTA